MAGVGAEMVFSVLDAGSDWAWPPVGPLGTGCRPSAVPVEHGCSLVVAGPAPPPAVVASVSLLGRARLERSAGVSAIPR